MYGRRKFSLRYRVEKWFYEDSKKDVKNLLAVVRDLFLLVSIMVIIFFAHAFFH